MGYNSSYLQSFMLLNENFDFDSRIFQLKYERKLQISYFFAIVSYMYLFITLLILLLSATNAIRHLDELNLFDYYIPLEDTLLYFVIGFTYFYFF